MISVPEEEPKPVPKREPVRPIKRPPLPEKREPSTGAAVIPFAVFARLSRIKADELAGFAHWARQNLPPRQTFSEWSTQHQRFQARPVR